MKSLRLRVQLCSAALGLFLLSFALGKEIAAAQSAANEIPCYAVLYPYNGHIGVFDSKEAYQNGEKPRTELDTPVSMLPQKDRIALKNGIVLFEKEELQKRLEDFE